MAPGDLEALLAPEPDWSPLPLLAPDRAGSVFLTAAPGGLAMRFYVRETRVVAKVHFGAKSEGPPGHAHGGSITTVLDEAMGKAVWLTGQRCLAGRLNVNFRHKVPLGTVARVEAWVEEARGRKVICASRLLDASGRELADAGGLFIKTAALTAT